MPETSPVGTTNQPPVDAAGNMAIAINAPLNSAQGINSVAVSYPPPSSANILCGTASTNLGVAIIIPAGRTWQGTIGLSAQASLKTTSVLATPNVTVVGSGSPAPASGTVIAQGNISLPAVGAGAIGAGLVVTDIQTITIAAGSANATVQLNLNNADVGSVSATGFLL